MIISILGCGWYGKALAEAFIKRGITVKGSTTAPEKLAMLTAIGIHPYLLQLDAEDDKPDAGFFECDVLIVSISPGFRKDEGATYLPKIQQLIRAIQKQGVAKVIYTSSTGVYGDHNCEVNELSDPAPDSESGKILLEAEKLLQQQTSFKTTIIRFGGLIGPNRDPGRFFAGKTTIPNGRAPVNLVHLDDCIGITQAIIQKDAFGYLFNACSPDHPSKAEFYMASTIRAALTPPEFVNELNNWKIVSSINVHAVLNYKFKVDLNP